MSEHCGCWTCRNVSGDGIFEIGGIRFLNVMVVCPECGNKRCPKATDHANGCTGSNDVGQEGSRYE